MKKLNKILSKQDTKRYNNIIKDIDGDKNLYAGYMSYEHAMERLMELATQCVNDIIIESDRLKEIKYILRKIREYKSKNENN